MAYVSRGLKKKEIETISHTRNCKICSGTGDVAYGNIETVEKGSMNLYDSCGECSGSGRVSHITRRIKRKSKVEVL